MYRCERTILSVTVCFLVIVRVLALLHLLRLLVRAQALARVLPLLVRATLLHFIEQLEQQTGFTAARHVARTSSGHFPSGLPEPFPRMLPFVQFPQVHRAGCCALLRLRGAPAGMLALAVGVGALPRVLPLGKLAQQLALYRRLTFQLRAPARMLPSLELHEEIRLVFALSGMLALFQLRGFFIIIVPIALSGMLPLARVLPFYQPVWPHRKQVWIEAEDKDLVVHLSVFLQVFSPGPNVRKELVSN